MRPVDPGVPAGTPGVRQCNSTTVSRAHAHSKARTCRSQRRRRSAPGARGCARRRYGSRTCARRRRSDPQHQAGRGRTSATDLRTNTGPNARSRYRPRCHHRGCQNRGRRVRADLPTGKGPIPERAIGNPEVHPQGQPDASTVNVWPAGSAALLIESEPGPGTHEKDLSSHDIRGRSAPMTRRTSRQRDPLEA
jgi:hypothetical protein